MLDNDKEIPDYTFYYYLCGWYMLFIYIEYYIYIIQIIYVYIYIYLYIYINNVHSRAIHLPTLGSALHIKKKKRGGGLLICTKK